MDRIFGVFSQADMSNTRSFGGIGLGLAITHRLIQAMGGRIHAESEAGKGSTFRFELPLQPTPPSAPPPPRPEALRGLRVLIVDDNAASRWILREHAALWGMAPAVAGEAREALELVRKGEHFDLAVIDAEMPGMDGLTLAEEIRREGSAGGLRIVALTSLDAPARGPEIPAGAALVIKPVKAEALLHALHSIRAPAPAPRPGPGTGGAPPELPPGLSILVAEDNPLNRKVVTLHLQRMGCEPVVVNNGLEALDAVRERKFDIILMDVQMPVMDGIESVREIRRILPSEARPWVIAVTANAYESDREACLAAGMDDYLSKPLRAEDLKRALHLAIGGVPPAGAEARQA